MTSGAAALGGDLPIVALLGDLAAALAGDHRAVVAAPPGAGKTTIIPLALAEQPWAQSGRIVMLEPRRLAARAAGTRMAALLGEPVGETVGYQTRDERRIGPSTRIEVLTEGVLTRRLQRDPELPGVVAVVFDEVHERNLTTDLGLALCLEVAGTIRPDLRLVAMSATADTARFAELLGSESGAAPILESAGRTYPIELRWRPTAPAATGSQRGGRRPGGRRPVQQRSAPAMSVDDGVVAAVTEALATDPGDILVFLPGIGEIRRVEQRLAAIVGPTVDVLALAGALSLAEQDDALRPSADGRRRVVLATDIAETSLTVAGVRVVVDAGLARSPKLDVGTGMTRLVTGAISRDSADQRAGRAGRTEPGVAYRLWSRLEHGTRPAHRRAEIVDVELAGLALELAAWGTDPATLQFLDPPPPKAWQRATELLIELGALAAPSPQGDAETTSSTAGRSDAPAAARSTATLTDVGRRMLALPLHPRLARIVVASPSSTSCALAAVLDERDPMRGRPSDLPVDLALRVAAVAGRASDERIDRNAARRAAARAADLARRAGVRFDPDDIDPDHLGALLLSGFPDRLAGRRRRGQFQLRSGSAVLLRDDDPLAEAAFIVAADLDGNRSGAAVRLAAAVEAFEIAAVLDEVAARRRLVWNDERDELTEEVERRLDALVIDRATGPASPGPETTAALVEQVRRRGLTTLTWSPAARLLQARVAFAAGFRAADERWPDLSDAALAATLDDWLAPLLVGATGRSDLAAVDVAGALRARLPWPLPAELDRVAPPTWTTPTGTELAIDYAGNRPTIRVRVQDVFGVAAHPTVGDGAAAITFELLSPADRPLQTTADLPGFWQGSWTDVRKEMAGRYPKHRWPDDPSTEAPGRLKRRPS